MAGKSRSGAAEPGTTPILSGDLFNDAASSAVIGEGWQRIHPAEWLACWSRIDGGTRVLATSERVLMSADPAAKEILTSGRPLRLRNLCLETSDPAQAAEFDRLFTGEREGVRTLCLSYGPDGRHLIVRATRVAALGDMDVVALWLRRADPELAPRWTGLRAAFGLTATEETIVVMLLGGSNAEVIAGEQTLSINTVRTHINHAYRKIQVTSREQLWRTLAPYRTL